MSNIFIPNADLRHRYKEAYRALGLSSANTLGLTAAQACYEHGADWLAQLKDYLEGNHAELGAYLARHAPQLRVVEPQSTYLVWVDCRALGLTDEQLQQAVERKAKLWVDFGSMFGEEGEGFVRLNIACPRSTVREMARRLALIAQ